MPLTSSAPTSKPGGTTSKPGGTGKNSKRTARRERLERSLRKTDDIGARTAANVLETTFDIERRHLRRRIDQLSDKLDHAARELHLERRQTVHLLKCQSLRHAAGLHDRAAEFAQTLNHAQRQHHDLLQATKDIAETRVAAALADAERLNGERAVAHEENTWLKARLARLEPPFASSNNP